MATTLLPVGAYPRPPVIPMSKNQQWWWDLEAIAGPLPHPSVCIQSRAPVDEVLLQRAITALVRRHEALRTRFICKNGSEVFPLVDPPHEVPLQLIDLSLLPTQQAQAAAADLVHQFRVMTYELNAGSLFRASLVKLSNEHFVVLLGAHHIVIDGHSLAIIQRDLGELYLAFAAGNPPPIAEKRIQLSDFCVWEQRWLQSLGCENPYEYWDTRLARVASVELPGDIPRTGQRYGFTEGQCALDLPERTVAGLRDLSRRHGITVQAGILAIYGLLLARWSGRTEILFGNYTAFRWPVGVADLVGCLAGNRPIYLHVRTEATCAEYLKQVWSAYAVSQDFPKVVGTRIAWDKQLNRVIANLSKASTDIVATTPSASGWRSLPVNHELALFLQESPNAVRGIVSYSTDHFFASTIERFCSDFIRLSDDVARDSRRCLADLVPQLSRSGVAGGL